MRTVLSTVSRASPGGFNIKDATKLLQPPPNRATLGGNLRHRSTSHSGTPSPHLESTSSHHENNKKSPTTNESKEPAEDKTIASSALSPSDDRFEQVGLICWIEERNACYCYNRVLISIN